MYSIKSCHILPLLVLLLKWNTCVMYYLESKGIHMYTCAATAKKQQLTLLTCSYKHQVITYTIWACGSIRSKLVSPAESRLISIYYGADITTVPTFQRLKRDREVFFCQQYSRVKRRNSYTIAYRQHYGHILYFTLLKNRPVAVVKKLLTRPNDSFPSSFITPQHHHSSSSSFVYHRLLHHNSYYRTGSD